MRSSSKKRKTGKSTAEDDSKKMAFKLNQNKISHADTNMEWTREAVRCTEKDLRTVPRKRANQLLVRSNTK